MGFMVFVHGGLQRSGDDAMIVKESLMMVKGFNGLQRFNAGYSRFIEDVITKTVDYHLFEVVVEFHRTKKPHVVLIITRKATQKANQTVATSQKKTIALGSTIKKYRSYFRMLYEKTSKTWTWWIEKQCPSGYKWKPKIKNNNEKTSVSLPLDNASRSNKSFYSSSTLDAQNLEVAFWKYTCFVRDLQGNNLLTGTRGSDLYIIALQESSSPTLICFMAKASPTQAWMVTSASYGPMWVESINGKKYILLIVDDYSRYTWTYFLRSKDETLKVLTDFLKMIQRDLQAQVINVRTHRGIEFLNRILQTYFKMEGISHQEIIARTPEQNDIVERRNHDMVEAD
ncbi:retrovirus-related pol polyprotein from transposon TNT 1-94 [Tanacetum coccineum]